MNQRRYKLLLSRVVHFESHDPFALVKDSRATQFLLLPQTGESLLQAVVLSPFKSLSARVFKVRILSFALCFKIAILNLRPKNRTWKNIIMQAES
jgi:hypothetical protein